MNRFRVGDAVELAGMDVLDHAYPPHYLVPGTGVSKEQVLALEEKQRRVRLKYGLAVRTA
jgi:hypothetical protein